MKNGASYARAPTASADSPKPSSTVVDAAPRQYHRERHTRSPWLPLDEYSAPAAGRLRCWSLLILCLLLDSAHRAISRRFAMRWETCILSLKIKNSENKMSSIPLQGVGDCKVRQSAQPVKAATIMS